MCSERDLGNTARERPVDRPGMCHCSVPESIQVVLRRIQILSFDDFTTVGPSAGNITSVNAPSRCDGGGIEVTYARAYDIRRHAVLESAQRLSESGAKEG